MDARAPTWVHFLRAKTARALCGYDDPGLQWTRIASAVTCRECLALLGGTPRKPSGEPEHREET